jgi:hypothetical protein
MIGTGFRLGVRREGSDARAFLDGGGHQWKPFRHDAWGFWSKREDPQTDDYVWFAGSVYRCDHCAEPHLQFVPRHSALRRVEVEQVDRCV